MRIFKRGQSKKEEKIQREGPRCERSKPPPSHFTGWYPFEAWPPWRGEWAFQPRAMQRYDKGETTAIHAYSKRTESERANLFPRLNRIMRERHHIIIIISIQHTFVSWETRFFQFFGLSLMDESWVSLAASKQFSQKRTFVPRLEDGIVPQLVGKTRAALILAILAAKRQLPPSDCLCQAHYDQPEPG